jgi:hypothetical protein
MAAAVLATLGLDYAFHFERGLRIGLTAAAAAVLLYIVWREMVRPLLVPMDIPGMALLVEKRFGKLGDRLITAVEFSARPPRQWEGVSSAMIEMAGAQANEMAQALDFRQVVERPRMKRVAMMAMSAVMLIAGFSLWQQSVMGMWFERNLAFSDVDWPQDTYLRVDGGPDFRVVRGDDLEVLADAGGAVPGQVLLHAEYASGEKMEVRMEPVAGAPRRFARKFPTVAEGFSFYVTGGDDELDKRHKHQVTVVDAPSLRQVVFHVDHRAYMNRKGGDSYDQSAGVIPVTPGSDLRIDGVANKDLSRELLSACRLVLDDKEKDAVALQVVEVPMDKGGKAFRGVHGTVHLPPRNVASSRTLKIVLTGQDGTVNRRGQQFVIQVQPDLAASVEIRKRGVGAVLTPMAYFPAILQVKDDYGVSEANLVVTCKNHPRRDLKVDSNELPAAREFTIEKRLDIQPYGYVPGDMIQVFAEVKDNMPEDFLSAPTEQFPDGAPGPNLSMSGQMEFRIVKPEELLESLVQRQKELRVEFTEAVGLHESSRGKGLQALQDAQAGKAGETAKALTGDASKNETGVGAECAKAGETLSSILEEMQFNRVVKPEEERTAKTEEAIRLLRDLAKPLAEASSELADCSRIPDAATLAAKLDPLAQKQLVITEKMKKIEDLMVEIQTLQEVEKEVLTLIERSKTILKQMEEEGRNPATGLFDQPASKPAGEMTPSGLIDLGKAFSEPASKPANQPATGPGAGERP